MAPISEIPGVALAAAGPSAAFWSTGSQWPVLRPVLPALFLTALIGVEREARAKCAGVRTHTLVGFGSPVFMIVSKYGFDDVLAVNHVGLDPSRIAAQIVSGIGFIGGGLIFVQRDVVRGLTTAATIWLAAAVGTAAGAGLPVLAVAATVGHYVITVGFPPLARLVNRRPGHEPALYLDYFDGQGVLRAVLAACTSQGWVVQRTEVDREATTTDGHRTAAVVLHLAGRGDLNALAAELTELPGSAGRAPIARTPSQNEHLTNTTLFALDAVGSPGEGGDRGVRWRVPRPGDHAAGG